jgi:hypothetical protein
MGQKLCGLGDSIQAVYLKSAMQRLEQGDVVTVTQFPRRLSQAELGRACLSGDINSARYKAMQPCRGLLKHLTSGGFGVKFSKDTGPCASQARRRIF